MSYIYLQEQGEESSAVCFSDIPQFVLSRLNLTAEKSYSKDNETESCQSSQSGTMCKLSMETHGEEKLMSSAEASPAKTYPQQVRGQESKDQEAVCGSTWRESSVKFDLNTLSWKTHQCLWEEDLAPSSLTLPKWGMMQSGALWERIMSPLLIDETESGFLLPTPTCADATMGAILNDNTKLIMLKSGKLRKISNQGVSGSIGLARTVAMWPTPRAGNPGSRPNGKGGKILSEEVLIAEGIRERGKRIATPQAQDFRTVAMYPTPSANEDAAGTPNGKMQKMLGNSPLIRGTTPEEWNGGTLNPTWVEWLMGWPLEWTDLKPLAMDKFLLWLDSHGKY